MSNTPTTVQALSSLRILKSAQCPLISPSSTGRLTYNIAHKEEDDALFLRIAANSGGGLFAPEWIALSAIQSCIAAQPQGEPFKSSAFRKLYQSTGANNAGFLAAVLRAEGLLLPVPKAPFSHLAGDAAVLLASIDEALRTGVSLADEVAEREKLRRERAGAMQTASPMQPPLPKKGKPPRKTAH